MSGELVRKLKYRASLFLKEAESVGDPDIAILFAEQAIQLYTKAVYYELFGDLIRGHRLRELLSLLIRELRKYGFNNLADKVMEFIDSFRRVLILVENAYTMSRYSELSYSADEAKLAVDTAQKLINLLEEVVRNVKLG